MGEVGLESKFDERKEYYARKISEYLDKYPNNFKDFVGDNEIIEKGDELLSKRLSTGYNFATFEQFPINSKDSLIFYAVYAERTDHLGELLARMEQKKIIKEKNVSFGVMGTKILGDYEDKEPVVRQIEMEDGSAEPSMESMEAIVIFHLDPGADKEKRMRQAARIGAFLLAEAPKIKGGFKDPNTRATATDELIKTLVVRSKRKFMQALATVYKLDKGNIIALRQELPIELDEEKLRTAESEIFGSLINRELYKYLSKFRVGR